MKDFLLYLITEQSYLYIHILSRRSQYYLASEIDFSNIGPILGIL